MKHKNPDCPIIEIGSGNCPKCNPEPERKPAWEWFDDVQNKLATEPKLVVKRRGKRHKW